MDEIISGSREVLCQSERPSHLLVYQRNGNPAILYAGRKLGMEVITCQDGVSEHCRKHGDQLLNQLFCKDAYAAAKKNAAKDNVVARVSHNDLQFIEVANVWMLDSPQDIRVSDVKVEEAKTTWRTGPNPIAGSFPSLEDKMCLILEHELDHYGLYLQADPEDKLMGIFTKHSIAEGAKIMDVAALAYTDIEIMKDFLSEDGNRVLSDMILTTKGILVDEDDVSLCKAN